MTDEEIKILSPFERKLYRNGYSRQMELTFPDCGPDKKARISSLLGWMAIFGGFDYDARGLTHDVLWERREVFLLSRAVMKIDKRPVDRDILNIRTWENGIHGARMRREYRMEYLDGTCAVSGKSEWILADPITRKILRPANFTARELLPRPDGLEIDCPEPEKIRFPDDKNNNNIKINTGGRIVNWSDLDGNGHVFSGNYADFVWDFLPADLKERSVKLFSINYSKEAVLGEKIDLRGAFADNDSNSDSENGENGCDYIVRGDGPDGTCFLCEIIFDE